MAASSTIPKGETWPAGTTVYLKSGSAPLCVVKDEDASVDLCWMCAAGYMHTYTVDRNCLTLEEPSVYRSGTGHG